MDEKVQSATHTYQVHNLVATTTNYRLYVCTQLGKEGGVDRECLLQIVDSTGHNGSLSREAFLLKELASRAEETEKEYAAEEPDAKPLNYQLGFPELVDSFVASEQGGRKVNILGFRSVERVRQLVPLRNITDKDKLRVDLRSSAWIMGKLLKLLVFAHSGNIAVKLLSGRNILIEPDQHYVLIFSWSGAQSYTAEIPDSVRREEIAQAAKAVIVAMGGNLAGGTFPDDGDPGFAQYTKYLLELASGHERHAQRAHTKFYELVDSLWPREFYRFTCHPLH